MTVGDLIVQRLLEAGTRHLFGMPGGGNLDLMESARRAGLPFVLSQTETGGAIMAAAQGEITGSPGACLATMGPGVTAIANGAATALLERAPLLIVSDRYPPETREVFRHQTFDQRAVLRPVTKWSGELFPDTAEETLEEALAMALAAPPGPVHLDCSVEASQSVLPDRPRPLDRSRDPQAACAEMNGLTSEVEHLLRQARRPLVIAGLGARRPDHAARIRRLCEERGIPALVTYKGKGVIPDAHPLFAGILTNGGIERAIIQSADVLIGLGFDPVELLARPWKHTRPVLYFGSWMPEPSQVPFVATLVGDVDRHLDTLESLLPQSTAWSSVEIAAAVASQRDAVRVGTRGLAPYRLVELVAGAVESAARVTVDAGAHMLPAMCLWPASGPTQILISNGLATMGYALPAAVGAGLLDRDRRTVVLTGDGGLLMCVAELATAVRERLNILVVVFNDASLSLIRIKQEQRHYESLGVSIGDVDWQAVGAGLGASSYRAANERELERAIALATAAPGVALIDARVDGSVYRQTSQALRE